MTKTTEELKREMYASLTGFTKAFTIGNFAPPQFAELENSLEAYLEALHQERIDLRNKLQAFEFANKSAGELLRDALATVRRQREYIRTLYTSRKAKTRKAPESSHKEPCNDDINPYGLERQIASCRQAVGRWQAIDGATDKQTLMDIAGILRDIPE